jgi:hypothetical protein
MNRFLTVLFFVASSCVSADGLTIDKVYHPYIQPLETEIEVRMISADGEQKYQIGIGKSFSDNLYFEVYAIGQDNNTDDLELSDYEIEVKYQLTEQGEFDFDWGVVTELERGRDDDTWELSSALIIERQWGRYIGTANLWLTYEWGCGIKNEFETAVALQARYRLSRAFEPAIEFYSSQDTKAIGPVAMGDIKFSGRRNLHWETGLIFGVDADTPDAILRLLTEYEF